MIHNVSVDFFEFLSTEFDICSKPPNRDNHRKASIQARSNVTRARVEPRSCDHGRCKNEAFTVPAAVPASRRARTDQAQDFEM